VVWCGVVWCGVVWCGVVWCGVVWRGVVWCGVVWCGVVWCGVVWCVGAFEWLQALGAIHACKSCQLLECCNGGLYFQVIDGLMTCTSALADAACIVVCADAACTVDPKCRFFSLLCCACWARWLTPPAMEDVHSCQEHPPDWLVCVCAAGLITKCWSSGANLCQCNGAAKHGKTKCQSCLVCRGRFPQAGAAGACLTVSHSLQEGARARGEWWCVPDGVNLL
jgi:hypothetical protein